jgi:hypothetical protein
LRGCVRFASHRGDRKQRAVWIYGIGEYIYPVVLLHAVLLPINVLKLVRLLPANRARSTVLADHVPPVTHVTE